MWRALLVGMGGFLGSMARYWVAGRLQDLGEGFPTGTFAVNVLGSFLLGMVIALSLERAILGPEARLFVAVGFCGGFTTMSTFSFETLALLQQGLVAAALANIAATVVICLVAVWAGTVVARLI